MSTPPKSFIASVATPEAAPSPSDTNPICPKNRIGLTM